MINARHGLVLATVALMSIVPVTPAVADVYENIINSGTIRVATDLGIPPFGMLDANLEPTGSDVAVAKALAEDWGLDVEFIATTGATRIPNVNTDKADVVISSLSVTAERAEVVDFTKTYSFVRTIVLAPADEVINDWEDLRGKSVAVTRGTTQDVVLTERAAEFNINVVRYEDDATSVTAAVSGQATFLGLADAHLRTINERSNQTFEAKLVLNLFPIAIGVKKGEPQLLEKLNEWIEVNAENGRLNEFYSTYHGIDVPAELLGADN